jgi:hypothetical protein
MALEDTRLERNFVPFSSLFSIQLYLEQIWEAYECDFDAQPGGWRRESP